MFSCNILLYSGNHYWTNKMKLENRVSAHEGLGQLPNSLRELWFEIGGSCHLRCSYCFAESGGKIGRAHV